MQAALWEVQEGLWEARVAPCREPEEAVERLQLRQLRIHLEEAAFLAVQRRSLRTRLHLAGLPFRIWGTYFLSSELLADENTFLFISFSIL